MAFRDADMSAFSAAPPAPMMIPFCVSRSTLMRSLITSLNPGRSECFTTRTVVQYGT